MSPMLLDRPQSLTLLDQLESPAMRPGGRVTLQSVLESAWDDLVHDHVAACPICHGRLRPRHSAGAGVVGGRCEDCGTTVE